MSDGLTLEVTSDTKGLKGVRTSCNEPRYAHKVHPVNATQCELPELDAAR